MKNFLTVKGDLFAVPHGSVLVHACNCSGKWGAGIALEFKQRYPSAYRAYARYCAANEKTLAGTSMVVEANGQAVGCLFTSRGYGSRRDSQALILKQTEDAVRHLLRHSLPPYAKVYSPKINAGKFGVPWEDTAAVLDRVLADYAHTGVEWTVVTL